MSIYKRSVFFDLLVEAQHAVVAFPSPLGTSASHAVVPEKKGFFVDTVGQGAHGVTCSGASHFFLFCCSDTMRVAVEYCSCWAHFFCTHAYYIYYMHPSNVLLLRGPVFSWDCRCSIHFCTRLPHVLLHLFHLVLGLLGSVLCK